VFPGDLPTEADLAAQFETSRTPVREALRILTQEMLLEHSPHWGYRVSRLDVRDLDDLYGSLSTCRAGARVADRRLSPTCTEVRG